MKFLVIDDEMAALTKTKVLLGAYGDCALADKMAMLGFKKIEVSDCIPE